MVANRKKVLILGGNRYNLPSILAAREMGFLTLVADKNPEAPGLNVADVRLPIDLIDGESLMLAIRQHGGVDGIVSTAEIGVRTAAHLSAQLGLSSITKEAAARATSKAAMRRLWAKMGKYTTNFEVVSTQEEAHAGAARLGRFPLIVKPDRSFGGSRGVTRIQKREEITGAFLAAKAGGLPNTDVVIEHWVDGSEHSAEVLIWERRTSVLCISQKVKSPFPYRVDLSVQYPAQLTTAQESVVADMCHEAVTALGLTQGVAHVEFAYGRNGPVLFELGARCGGGHTPQIAHHVSGVAEFTEVCRMACGISPEGFVPVARRAADYRFLIFPPGKLANICVPDELKCQGKVLDVDVTLRPGDCVKQLQTTSDRGGFVVTLAESLREAVDSADWACQQISVTYYDGTRASAFSPQDFEVPAQ